MRGAFKLKKLPFLSVWGGGKALIASRSMWVCETEALESSDTVIGGIEAQLMVKDLAPNCWELF